MKTIKPSHKFELLFIGSLDACCIFAAIVWKAISDYLSQQPYFEQQQFIVSAMNTISGFAFLLAFVFTIILVILGIGVAIYLKTDDEGE
jgi:ABC-type phosphate transport system permease subunit